MDRRTNTPSAARCHFSSKTIGAQRFDDLPLPSRLRVASTRPFAPSSPRHLGTLSPCSPVFRQLVPLFPRPPSFTPSPLLPTPSFSPLYGCTALNPILFNHFRAQLQPVYSRCTAVLRLQPTQNKRLTSRLQKFNSAVKRLYRVNIRKPSMKNQNALSSSPLERANKEPEEFWSVFAFSICNLGTLSPRSLFTS